MNLRRKDIVVRRLSALMSAAVILAFLPLAGLPVTTGAQTIGCANYDTWVWAQTVYESNKTQYAALDQDGVGIACPDLPISGFAPVLWSQSIPASAEAAQIVSVTDGDTFKASVKGAVDTVRMYHMNTPETNSPTKGVECGGADATKELQYIFQFVPNQTVYLEYDQTKRDKYDRRLAYVWFQIGSDVYLVNEAMVRTGWAESTLYKPDNKYGKQLDAAEQFSVEHVLGVRLECGKFGQPVGSKPSQQQLQQAMAKQPNQGQFAGIAGGTDGESSSGNGPQTLPVPAPTQPVAQEPPAQQPATGNCDPSYPTVCIPSPPPDLDCKDIPYRRFTVLPPDPHHFDADHDGIGCESG